MSSYSMEGQAVGKTGKNNMSEPKTSVNDSPPERLNVVLCGSNAAVKASISDLLVGQREQRVESSSVCVRREAEVSGHLLTLVEMPALYNTHLSEEQVMQQTLHCVSLCPTGVHAFLFAVAEECLADEENAEMERIQSIFSSRVLQHTIVLLSQDEVELDQSVRSISECCKGRAYHLNSNSSVSKLLGRIEQLLVDNHRGVYTPIMYLEVQVEAQQRYKSEIAEMKAKICTLQAKMSRPDTITIVLLGKTGVGKSAAGNTIFGGRNVFREDLSHKPITTVCQKETAEVDERQITVIDTPALLDTEAGHEEVRKEIRKFASMATPGPHVFLLVLRVGQRFSGKEDLKMIQDIFGEHSVKYTMLLFTEGDRLGKTSIEQYLGEPGSDMMKLVEECGNRYHVFNNNERRDHSQVTDLLHKIYNMNKGSCYTNQMFQQVEIEKHEERERILRMRVAELEREKQELIDKHKAEIEDLIDLIKEERRRQENEKKRREEEFNQKEQKLLNKVKEKEEQHKLTVAIREEEYEKRRLDEEKRLVERENMIYQKMEKKRDEFERQSRGEKEQQERREWEEKSTKDRAELVSQIEMLKTQKKDCEKKTEEEKMIQTSLEKKLEDAEKCRIALQEELETAKKTIEYKKNEMMIKDENNIKQKKENKSLKEEIMVLKKKIKVAEKDNVELKERLEEEIKWKEMSLKSMDTIIKEGKSQDMYRQEKEEEMKQIKKCSYSPSLKEGEETTLNSEEKRKLEELMTRLNLQNKLTTADFHEITNSLLQDHEPSIKLNVVPMFVQKLLLMDYRARYCVYEATHDAGFKENDNSPFLKQELKYGFDNEMPSFFEIHPMDVQMAVFHCSDSFLKQLIMTKLSQCQYALPLLVPDPFTRVIEFPLWTFRQIKKSWKCTDQSGKITNKTVPICEAETPMVAFFRLGSISSSKSQLINNLINEKHNTFFHRNCPGSSRNRLLMDGVVEIAWYCPCGKSSDHFTDCVAFCNLHGDAGTKQEQYEILTNMATVNVVFLPDFGQKNYYKGLVRWLFRSPKPLICILTDDDSDMTEISESKYIIGLKEQKSTSGDKNQHHLSETLKKTIRKCLAGQSNTFRLEDVVKTSTGIRVDEQNEDCQRGKSAALNLGQLLEGTELTSFKEIHLPCQGKLWHEWCKKNKELHQPHGHNIEMYMSDKLQEMSRIREEQRACNPSKLVEIFTDNLKSPESKENLYFLKWVEIVFSKVISNGLYKLHQEYEEQWTKAQQCKSNQTTEQMELEKISERLNSASFGIEHILREMGQKFESHHSTCSNVNMQSTVTSFPAIAAEVMMCGYPLELMDGDAAHVPLVWVSAVLDEVIKKLGDLRVFVLSVLGLQSSGKSTLLNAMFGLQFAVSAGRCTRGAFMQLVKVSEDMKKELKFDYILIVDTEGLRASELDGMSTRNHDNELAAFVVGLGNLTLINIMGENPAEMQDILQIVVQAFLRMKKVRLNPSCMFVHQNVGDITADESTMEGRRRLQKKLDEMTALAANEEVCDAERFSDVIAFDVKSDVRYFAHLWEGSPPLAPLNPSYIEHVQELKKSIISKAKHSDGLTFSQLKDRVKDLWTALLHENFVFSFKNTREIAVYRKLEEEYGKWTWKLRSAMLEIQDNLHTKINNRQIQKVDYQDLVNQMKGTLQTVEELVNSYFDLKQDGRDILVEWRGKFHKKVSDLHEELLKQTKRVLDDIIYQKEACKKLDEQKTQYEGKLFEKSKELALELRGNVNNEEELEKHFSSVWGTWISDLTRNCPVIKPKNIKEDTIRIISSVHEGENVSIRKGEKYNKINRVHDFNKYVNMKKAWWKKLYPVTPTLPPEEQQRIMDMTQNIIDKTEALAKSKPVAKMGYNESYIFEIAQLVKKLVAEHKPQFAKYEFKREFILDLTLHVCELAAVKFAKMDKEFREATDPLVYLEKMKSQYYSVFQKFCQSATSAAAFGCVICSKLEESITNSVYIRTARNLADEMMTNIPAFNGNRSNMEKHILKSLAEEESFERFMSYIFRPRKHFENFIKDQVKCYLKKDNPNAVAQIRGIIEHKQQRVITAAETATDEVMKNKGDVNMWLENFSNCLKEELEFNIEHLTVANCGDISDVQLLKEVVGKEIDRVKEKLKAKIPQLSDLNMEKFRKRPDEILIEHFCKCCWAKCPFCNAICTNTMEDHDGEHSAPFHRNCGINGWHYRGTQNLSLSFCTSAVASDRYFYASKDNFQGWLKKHIQEDDVKIPWKQYRSAGPPYADWNITPDLSELPYWKWFVCRFQKDLEKHYSKTFQGSGRIPDEWRKYKKNDAKDSVDKYI